MLRVRVEGELVHLQRGPVIALAFAHQGPLVVRLGEVGGTRGDELELVVLAA